MRPVLSIVMTLATSICPHVTNANSLIELLAKTQKETNAPIFSVTITRNSSTGNTEIEARVRIGSNKDPQFEKFFQTYSLSDFTKLPQGFFRDSALELIVAYGSDFQGHKSLDSDTVRSKQKEILDTYLETADSSKKIQIYEAAFHNALSSSSTTSIEIFSFLLKAKSKIAVHTLCKNFSTTYELNIGQSHKWSDKERKEQAAVLEAILEKYPGLNDYECEHDSVTLRQYQNAIKSNIRIPLLDIKNQKEIAYEPPPLTNCNRESIRRLFQTSLDGLVESPNETVAYFGSTMRECQIEGRFIKATSGILYFPNFGKSKGHGIPIQELAKYWELKIPEIKKSNPPQPAASTPAKAKPSR